MTDTKELDNQITEALALIDRGLGDMLHRELVSTDEVADLLLDVRSILAGRRRPSPPPTSVGDARGDRLHQAARQQLARSDRLAMESRSASGSLDARRRRCARRCRASPPPTAWWR